jgi:hypothetical protein
VRRARGRWNLSLASIMLSLCIAAPGVRADSDSNTRISGETEAQMAPPLRTTATQIRLQLPSQLKSSASDNSANGGITQQELRRLADHDIVLIIDKSFSMATRDCPSSPFNPAKFGIRSSYHFGEGDLLGTAATRWDWCFRQTIRMAKQTQGALANGFTVVIFDSNYDVFQHVTVGDLPNIFGQNHPWGHTNMAKPLSASFEDYFRRMHQSNGRVKPLLIGIISDGCPSDEGSTVSTIVSATRMVKNPAEINLVFFLIGGADRQGEKFVWNLCHNLVDAGATYPAVKAVPFNELERLGLARALADNLN